MLFLSIADRDPSVYIFGPAPRVARISLLLRPRPHQSTNRPRACTIRLYARRRSGPRDCTCTPSAAPRRTS
ncbi:hypothetical protein C8R44DRAFT_987734, partial [Mycena epipterygia]